MDRTSLVSLGGQIVVIGLDGQLKTLAQNEQPLPGELIVARTEAEPEKLQVQVAREEGVQDVTDDVAQIIDALQDGQDPTLLNEEFAPAAGESNGSSLQASGTVERTAAELLADTVFETTGLAALGFSETQSLTLAELYLNLPNTSPAVTPIAPVAEDDNIQTDEDVSITIDVLANDDDEDSDSLTIDSATVPEEQGTVAIVDGELVFTPAEDFNGEATITYVVTDGELTDEATVSVTVNPVNDAPVANNDSTATDEDTPVTIDVLLNDTDVDGDTLTIVNASVPAEQGTVEIVDGKLVFTPAEDFNGEATITYVVTDGELTDEATVSVTVNPVNDAPVANDDSTTTDEDTPVTIDVLPNDSDVDGDTLTIVNASVPAEQGTVEIVDGKLVFTPAENFNGDATISYTVSDGALEDEAEVSVTVNPLNDAPTTENAIPSQVLQEDFAAYTINLNDAFSDVDDADSELIFTVSGNSNIQVSIVDGIATITPTADWNGSEELTFTATDPDGESVSQTVDFTVNAVADIVADSADIVEDTPTVLNVLGNDTFEGQSPVVSVEAGNGPANGTVVVNDDGTITYTPDQDYNGSDEFTYTVTSGGVTETTTVTLNVTPVNDKPVVENTIADQVLSEDFTPYTIDLNDAFSDVDNADSELTFSVSGNSNIQVSIVDGIATITPTADWNGSEELTFTATDLSGLEASQTVDFTVNAVADIVSDSANIVEDTPTILGVLDNDSFEGQSPVVSVEAGNGPANGSVVVNDDGTITYTPDQDYNGADEFTYTVTSGGVTETTTVTLNVTPVNDKPVVENTIADQVLPEDFTPYTIDLNDAFSDVDNADSELTFSVSGNSNIQVSIVDAIATITPTADWNGSEELTFTATDPDGESVSQTVDFTVNAVADIVADSADIVEDTPTILDVLDNDSFEGQSPVVSVEAGNGPANGSVFVNDDGTITYTPNQDYNGTDEFTYTVTSGGVTETTTVTLNVTPVNDKPLNEDFDHSADELITNVIFDTDDKPLDQGSESDHISDVEDDLNGDDLQILITELPTSGTLYFKDENGDLQEITSADGSLYNKDSIYYEVDNVGFLLGIKDRPNSPNGEESTTDFYNWGLSADGGESHSRTEYLVNGASIDISSDSGVLAQYNREVSHIGHGIADNDGQGIQRGETISIDLSENPVGSVNLGLDGLGGLFEHGDNNAALITVTYLDANGTEQTQVIEFLKPEGNNMLFQETSIGFGKDYPLPEGAVITQLDFSTKTSGNWELRYVEGFPPEDSFDYVVVDSGNAESDPATVTIANQVLDGNVSKNGPDLSLTGNTVTEGEDVTFSVVLDEATETAVKYPITTLAPGSSADDSDVNLSNATYTNGVVFAGGYLIVPAGVSSFEIIVPTIDDSKTENLESIVVEVGNASGIGYIQDDQINNVDEDATAELTVSTGGDVTEGDDSYLEYTISLSEPVSEDVVLNLSTGGTATSDVDYDATYLVADGNGGYREITADELKIAAGETELKVYLQVKDDAVTENSESVELTASTTSGKVTGTKTDSATANILDDQANGVDEDATAELTVSTGGDVTEGDDSYLEYTISLSEPVSEDVALNLSRGDTATSDVDYEATYLVADGNGGYREITADELKIAAGETELTVYLKVKDDVVTESAESVELTASTTSGKVTGTKTDSATANILDDQANGVDEDATAELTVSTGGDVTEGDDRYLEYTISLSEPVSEDVVLNLSTDGTATSDVDYEATYLVADGNGGYREITADELKIEAGETELTVYLKVKDDAVTESAESVELTASTTSGKVTGTKTDSATANILDDQANGVDKDATAELTVSAGGDVTEGDDSYLEYTISLSEPVSEDVVLNLSTDGTATSDVDYDATYLVADGNGGYREITADELKIAAGETELTVYLKVKDDAVTESAESAESVELTASTTSVKVNGTKSDSATASILDDQANGVDEDATAELTVSAGADVTEGDDSYLEYTISLSEPVSEDVALNLSTSGTATTDVDYDATYLVADGNGGYREITADELKIAAGETELKVYLQVKDDAVTENSESVELTASTTSGKVTGTKSDSATANILDDQANSVDEDATAELTVSAGGDVTEGDDSYLEYTISLSEPVSEDVVASLSTGGTATSDVDYDATYLVADGNGGYREITADELKIAAGETELTVYLQVKDDAVTESAESVELTASTTSGKVTGTKTDSATASILDDQANGVDEDATAALTVSAGADVTEGDDSFLEYTISLSEPVSEDVVLNLSTGGTATSDVDYDATYLVADGNGGYREITADELKIAAGETELKVYLQVKDDAVTENSESVELTASTTSGKVTGTKTDSATASILDDQANGVDEDATAALTVSAGADVTEGDDSFLEYTISLSEPVSEDVVLNLSTGGTATSDVDYDATYLVADGNGGYREITADELKIAAGETELKVYLQVKDDSLIEDKESVTLNVETTSALITGDRTDSATAHIHDEDNPPKSEDFTVEVSSGNRTQVIFDHESEEKGHISDEEDDAANEQLHVVITELPEHGTLFHNGVEIKEADLYQGEGDTTYTKFDPELIEYQPDSHSEGFSLGINSNADTQPLGQPDRGSSTSDFYNWGEKVNANTRELKLDGGDIVTIRSEGGKLTQYSGDESANHVGYGLGVGGKQGVNEGEKLIIEFDSRPADSITLGLDGLGGYFEKELGNANESSVVITVNYEGGSKTFEFQKESSGNSDLFHSLTIPSEGFDLPENVEITSIELTTEGKGNWELRSVETSLSYSFDYRALDSDGNFSDVSTVTFEETNQAPDAQNDPVGFEVKLGSFNEGSWTSQGAAISANYAGEARLVTEDGDKRGVAGHENGGEEAQLQFNRETGKSEQFVIDLDKPATEFSFTVSNLYKDEGDQAGNHEQGKWVAYLNGVAVASDTFVANDGNHKGEYTVDLTKDGKPIAFDKIVFEATDFVDVPAKGNDSSDYFVTGFQASSEGAYAVNQGGVLEIPVSELLANDSDLDGDSIRITYVYGESQGEAYIKEGVVYFDLNGDFVGQTDFQYQITDDRGGFDTASVSVVVNPEPVEVVVESIDLLSNQVVEGDELAFKVSLDSGALEETRLDIEFGQLGDDASENDINLTNVVFTNGVKYDNDAGELIIPVGVKDFTVLIPTVVDGVHELDEDYSIKVGDVSSSGTIVNAEALNLSVTSLGDVAEGSKAVFSVALTNPSSEDINISLNLALDGSENSAEVEDFKALSELFTAYYLDPQPTGDDLRVEVPVTIDSMTGKPIVEIPAGASEVFIEVATQDDVVFEGSEDFTLVVTGESGYVANNFGSAHSSIVDDGADPDVDGPQTGNDDRPIVESISSFDVEEGAAGQFIVELSNTSESETTVAMSLNDGSAKGGEDFNVSSVTVVFGSGDDKQVDTVEVIDGKFVVTVPEGLDSFVVGVATIQDEHSDNLEQFSLSGKTSYQDQAESGVATILDNEAPLVDLNGSQSGVDYSSNYVGGDEARLATIDVDVFDDKDTIRTMTITLTNPKEGDDLTWDESSVFTVNKAMIDGEVVLQITHPSGDVSAAVFESFLRSTRFINTSDTPDEEERVIEVLVSDGINTSVPAIVSVAVTQEEELSLQNVVGLEDKFIDLGIVINDAETSVTTVELSGIPQGSTLEINGQASVVNSADAIVISIDDISSVKVKAPEHSDVNFDVSVVAKDDSNTIVETGSISVDVHPDADKPILNIGGFAQVAAIDFEDVTIKSGSWDSDIEINKVEGVGTVGQWFTSNPGQHVEVGTEGTYLPGSSTNQVMEIEGEVGDKILYTDMDLVAGRFYNFEFDIAARTNKAHTSDMSVTLIKLDDQGNPIDGSEVELYDFDPTTHGWYQGESITLPVEESGKYRLLFEADEADSTGAIMDNIKFTAVDNLGYEDSFIKLSEIDASLQDSLDQSESLKVELTGIPVGSVLKDGEGDSANIYVVTQENKDDRIDVTGWDLSNLQVKAQDAGVFAITVIATSTERDTNKDDQHGDHSDVGGSLTAEITASINVEVIDKPASGEPVYTAGDDMIDSVAYRAGHSDFNWQQSAAYSSAGRPEQNGLYDYDPDTGISIDVGTGNDKVFLGDGDDTIYLGESHVQEQDGDIPENEFASVLNDFANTALNNLTNTANDQDQALKAESQSKAGLDIGHGSAGDDVIFGEEGSDIVFGGTGHDILDGGEGSDAVRGGSGNDILIGGSRDDILIGDDGEDIFKFIDDGSGIRDGEIDTIKDFTKGEDKIDISDLLHTDDSDSIDSLLANNEIGLEADGDNLILTISESDGSASQKVVIEGGSSQYSEFLSDGSLSSADGSAILNDLLKINNDMS
ncbi:tandem-95 repeat protein [Vibrio owensii]|uniref:tandem-95 repeat protein n=1 Tax=Vibrio owensii TaxID=696485 RepID=UPI003399366B